MNKQQSIKIINSFKAQIGLKNKKYTEDNLLKLKQNVLNNKGKMPDEQFQVLMNFILLAEDKKTLSVSIIKDKDIIDNLFSNRKVQFYNSCHYVIDGKMTTFSNKQLNKFYKEAAQKNPSITILAVMKKSVIDKYKKAFIKNKEKTEIMNTINVTATNNLPAEYFVEKFLRDKKSKYQNGNFEIYNTEDTDKDIIFLIRDNLKDLLGNKTFSELKEPTVCDEKINQRILFTFSN